LLTTKSVTTQKLIQGKKSGNQIQQVGAPSEETERRRKDGNHYPQINK
jgi:hypothetical protein